MVSDAQKASIKTSWQNIDLQKAGIAFYTQMHDQIPQVYAVFKLGNDLKSAKVATQGLKTMQFIDDLVKDIDNMAGINSRLAELADRHTKYGAKKAHFGPAAPCLLDALKETQGAKFNDEAKAAWASFYNTIIAPGISAKLS